MDGARTNDRDEDSITVYVCPVTGLEFVDVPEGDFEMGDLWGKGDADEQLRCRHRIGAFRLSRTLVTQSMWRDVMKSNPAEAYGEDFVGEEKPVVGVSLNDVQAFIKRLNEHIVRGRYRLPTEAEWEYAARSGGAEEQWPGTNQEEALERYAWFGISKVQPVGQKLPNGLGLYDMAGNVWEWTCSKYKERYDGSEVRCAHHDSGAARTVRGGSWHDKPHGVRTTDRDWNTPSIRCDDLGFRLVHEL
jgi:formylglycine-generating enzyme required for sulfatase activity